MGYRIFTLCLWQLRNNWRMAIRLSWFWMLILVAIVGMIFYLNKPYFDALELAQNSSNAVVPNPADVPSGNFFVLVLISIIVSVIAYCIIAIGWHRFMLREEIPDRFYVVRPEWRLGRYFWNSFKIGFLVMLAMIPLMMILMIPFSTVSLDGWDPASGVSILLSAFLLGQLIISTFATWMLLRMGMILPAVAVDRDMTIGDSFRLTRSISGQLVITAFFVVLLQFIPVILQQFAILFYGPTFVELSWVTFPINMVFSWVSFFVGFGVLTVVYGHLAENKPL